MLQFLTGTSSKAHLAAYHDSLAVVSSFLAEYDKQRLRARCTQLDRYLSVPAYTRADLDLPHELYTGSDCPVYIVFSKPIMPVDVCSLVVLAILPRPATEFESIHHCASANLSLLHCKRGL